MKTRTSASCLFRPSAFRLSGFQAFLLLAAFSLQAFRLFSQQVAQPALTGTAATTTTGTTAVAPVTVATTGTTADGEEIINLSPFNVTGARDVGYESIDTASGSRVRTALRDTPASIVPFTQEMLDDIGATTVEDLITYAPNMELGIDDDTGNMNNAAAGYAGNSNNAIRIRGIAATTLVDYATYYTPVDRYNMGRAEISSGPNSILYGIGAQGGIVNMTRAQADAQRNKLRVTTAFGTWTSPAVTGIPYRRYIFDYNVVLKPRILGFRLLGLWQDGANNSWRYWQTAKDRRLSPNVYIKPFKNTVINIAYEQGRRRDATSNANNAADQITGWLNPVDTTLGKSPIIETPGTGQSIPGVITNIATNPTDEFTYMNNGGAPGQVFNLRQAYQTTFPWTNGATDPNNPNAPSAGATNNNQIRLPQNMSSSYYSTVGPGGKRDQKFNNWDITIQQTIARFNFELSWIHSKTDNVAFTENANDVPLRGDPNRYIEPATWTAPSGAPDGYAVLNPNAGDWYMEAMWFRNTEFDKNDTVHLITNYDYDLKKWGRHRIVNLLEHSENETRTTQKFEILADQYGVAITNALNPDTNANQLTRRNYVTPGDFRTYYAGDPTEPVTGLQIGDRIFHSTYATRKSNSSHIKQSTNSAMLLLQSYWFNNRLATLIGGRLDRASITQEQLSPVDNPTDPRIRNGSKVWNENDFNGVWTSPQYFTARTASAGAVWHVTDRLSALVNYSNNRGFPYTDGRTVLPSGDIPPLTKGSTFEYGVMFSSPDSKWNLRLVHYDTRQDNNASITAYGSVNNDIGATLGSSNLFNIYDALTFLVPTGQTGTPVNYGGNFPAGTGFDADGKPLGPMTLAQYAVRPPSLGYPNGSPPLYNSAQVGTHSQGYELTLTANPTKNLTLSFNFSYTQREKENIAADITDYFNKNIPIWLKMADPNRNGGYDANGPQYDAAGIPQGTPAYTVVMPVTDSIIVPTPAGTLIHVTNTPSLYDYILTQLYSTGNVIGGNLTGSGGNLSGNGTSVRTGIDNTYFNQSGSTGGRPFKFNLTTRYSFLDGMLKGFAVGGSVRYQSFAYQPSPDAVDKQATTLPDLPLTADSPIPQNLGLDQSIYNETKKMVQGHNSTIFWDFLASYRCKLFGGRTTMKLQLNIKNIFNDYIVTVGRTGIDPSGNTFPRRYYINAPRTYRLTATFDF